MGFLQKTFNRAEKEEKTLELTDAQKEQLNSFKEEHRTKCGMDMYQLVTAYKDGQGETLFAKCPVCSAGIEVEG